MSNPMKSNLKGLRDNARAMRKDDLKSRYGKGAKKPAEEESRPVPGAEDDTEAMDLSGPVGTPSGEEAPDMLEGSPAEEMSESPEEAASEPDAPMSTGGDLGAHSTADDVVAALKAVPPDVLEEAMMQLMPPKDDSKGGDNIDSDLAGLAGRMSSRGFEE